MFLDEAHVVFRSGDGGSGAVAFHREKHVPRGGPNGADGGRGGDIVLVADRSKRTLYDFNTTRKIEAEDGVHALGNKKGKDGKGVVVKVPVGTIVIDTDLNETLVDLNQDGMKFVLCRGGRGGHGNEHFVNSVRQVPTFAEKGAPGETVRVKLELKLLADVGLIGLPNAGKSTLLSRISSARPKIADYPFTTIVPNLGVVAIADTSYVVADLPGLIEGASQGLGLGHQFLRHVERTRALLHVVDCYPIDGSDPIENFHLIETELRRYSEELSHRPRLVAMNKIDIVPHGEFGAIRERFEALNVPLYPISGATGDGIEKLLYALLELVKEAEPEAPSVVVGPPVRQDSDEYTVEETEEGFVVGGRRIRRMVAMTDLENDEAVRYLHKRLVKMGVIDKLREVGAKEGDNVMIGEAEFTFTDEA